MQYSALEVVKIGLGKAAGEPLDGNLAADAALAIDDDRLGGIEAIEVLQQATERYQLAADVEMLMLARFAHINQLVRLAGGLPGL